MIEGEDVNGRRLLRVSSPKRFEDTNRTTYTLLSITGGHSQYLSTIFIRTCDTEFCVEVKIELNFVISVKVLWTPNV